jgi:hypothetical protein
MNPDSDDPQYLDEEDTDYRPAHQHNDDHSDEDQDYHANNQDDEEDENEEDDVEY